MMILRAAKKKPWSQREKTRPLEPGTEAIGAPRLSTSLYLELNLSFILENNNEQTS